MQTSRSETDKRLKAKAEDLLKGKKVDALLALISKGNEGPRPSLFTRPEEVEYLTLRPRYLLATLAKEILSLDHTKVLGVVARGCDERALIELAKIEQVDLNRVELLGVACTEQEARECLCPRPYPSHIDPGERTEGMNPLEGEEAQGILTLPLQDRLAKWREMLSRCLRCYGCRNACPLCVCEICKLSEDPWVSAGHIPPDPLAFHMIRAYHLADRCVACGACYEACPAGIPLRSLYITLREHMKAVFDYEPGLEPERGSPLHTSLSIDPMGKEIIPKWASSPVRGEIDIDNNTQHPL